MNWKGIDTRDERLSIRVPHALKKDIERHAAKSRKTVADTVIPILEAEMRRVARRRGHKRG